MKLTSLFIGMLSYLTATFIYADTGNNKQNASTYKGEVHLDQSKDVFFDQLGSSSFSLQLLQTKNKFNPHDMIIGGSVQTDLQQWHGNELAIIPAGKFKEGSGLYITQATIDIMNNINSWATTYLSLADGHILGDENSLFIQHAMLLLGNQDKFPFYFTTGINGIPFGVFSGSGPWDSPLTSAYFNPSQGPQVSLGYIYKNVNAVATRFEDTTNHQYHNAYLLSYSKPTGTITFNLGTGYLTDLKTNNTGSTPIRRARTRRTPPLDMGAVWDYNGSIGYGAFSLTGEYVHGTSKVAENKQRPNASAYSLSYAPTIYGKVTTFAIGYSITSHLKDTPTPLPGEDAIPVVALGIKNNWALSVSRSIFIKNLVLGLEAERTTLYENKHTYTYTADLVAYL